MPPILGMKKFKTRVIYDKLNTDKAEVLRRVLKSLDPVLSVTIDAFRAEVEIISTEKMGYDILMMAGEAANVSFRAFIHKSKKI